MNLLVAVTGSVATIKIDDLLTNLKQYQPTKIKEIRFIYSSSSLHFFDVDKLSEKFEKDNNHNHDQIKFYNDDDEYGYWKNRGDPVLHIDLAKWADIFLIAPLSANSLAKIANGLCDNLVTCVVRAFFEFNYNWPMRDRSRDAGQKFLILCPAMNTNMFEHPSTRKQLLSIKYEFSKNSNVKVEIIKPVAKKLMCGVYGTGAMAEVETIVRFVGKIRKLEANGWRVYFQYFYRRIKNYFLDLLIFS